ncbi:CRISPR-associated protein Cas4 [Limihaloglobus sulfuriphilus]|uniref:CRISPR-associated protein Cas4 n=1 Tax=Limihaloglobus sulfuriphilus TaxID=1851148 RepID=A0A1Q2MG44_9BACT|nr:type V CRISPR-associated protein Cas4 [Limihaloglobus sulfuriphilus]AQQ71624.1 CRISPR-associated protein Cas4 [Limihaloglobus sulfuriphilus]
METYILISQLNDFIFCPKSIYFHQLYGGYSTRLYHDTPQIEGKAAHKAIDIAGYSTKKSILQGLEVYSQQYGVCGKIDLFDTELGLLTERKKHISTIYDGYVYQLYAQYWALIEMGHDVRKLRFYSSDTNRVYPIDLPADNPQMQTKFEMIIEDIRTCDIEEYRQTNVKKCRNCIYEPLCDVSLC